MSDHLDDLLAAVGALPGARCRGRHHLFDECQPDEPAEVAEQRHNQAVGLCQRCTALASCQQWFDSLPRRQRPEGVIAGRLHPKPVGRPDTRRCADCGPGRIHCTTGEPRRPPDLPGAGR